MKTISFFIPLLLFVCFACSKESEHKAIYSPENRFALKDVSYGEYSRNVLDIVLPGNRNEQTKVVILVHGGGWKEGNKSDFEVMAKAFGDSGIVAVSLNYRYANAESGVDCEDILADIGNAISFLKKNETLYGCRFEKMTMMGASAGGHLSLLYAYKTNNPIVIEKVISLAGPSDLTAKDINAVNGMQALLQNLVGDNKDSAWLKASPIYYNTSIATFLFHGKNDSIVPYNQSVSLFSKFSSNNPDTKLFIFENTGHEFADVLPFIFMKSVEFIKK